MIITHIDTRTHREAQTIMFKILEELSTSSLSLSVSLYVYIYIYMYTLRYCY